MLTAPFIVIVVFWVNLTVLLNVSVFLSGAFTGDGVFPVYVVPVILYPSDAVPLKLAVWFFKYTAPPVTLATPVPLLTVNV